MYNMMHAIFLNLFLVIL